MKWYLSLILFSCLSAATLNAQTVRVIEGLVTDHKGKPVKGAAVEWGHFASEREDREVFRTDNHGRYRVESTKAGIDFRLGVSAAGLAPQWRDRVIPLSDQTVTVDFKLTLPLTLRGRILDRSGSPIAGATVYAQSPAWGVYSSFSQPMPSFPFPGPQRTSVTDQEGSFLIRNLPTTMMTDKRERGHTYRLFIKSARGASALGAACSNEYNELRATRSDLLQGKDAVGAIHGRVVDNETDQPIKNFGIVIRHRPSTIPISSELGEFHLNDLRFGRRLQLFIYADGYAPCIQHARVGKPNDELQTTFRLVRSESLKGILVGPDGQPIKGAEILYGLAPAEANDPNRGSWRSMKHLVDGMMGWQTVQRVTTTADGAFSFSQFPQADPGVAAEANVANRKRPKTQLLMIMPPQCARTIVTVDEQERTNDGGLKIQLKPESVINVKVLSDGKFDPKSTIDVSAGSNFAFPRSLERREFDDDGNYRLDRLASGAYRINASVFVGTSHFQLVRQFRLGEGETVNVTMNRLHGKSTLRGKTASFATVELTPKSNTPEFPLMSVSTEVDADGRYLIEGLIPGTYHLSSTAAQSQLTTAIMRAVNRSEDTVEISGETKHDIALDTRQPF